MGFFQCAAKTAKGKPEIRGQGENQFPQKEGKGEPQPIKRRSGIYQLRQGQRILPPETGAKHRQGQRGENKGFHRGKGVPEPRFQSRKACVKKGEEPKGSSIWGGGKTASLHLKEELASLGKKKRGEAQVSCAAGGKKRGLCQRPAEIIANEKRKKKKVRPVKGEEKIGGDREDETAGDAISWEKKKKKKNCLVYGREGSENGSGGTVDQRGGSAAGARGVLADEEPLGRGEGKRGSNQGRTAGLTSSVKGKKPPSKRTQGNDTKIKEKGKASSGASAKKEKKKGQSSPQEKKGQAMETEGK